MSPDWISGPFHFTAGKVLVKSHPTQEDFEKPMERLFQLHRNVNWWIGDLFAFGEHYYGDEIYQQVADWFSHEHVDRCVKTSRGIQRKHRNPNVSWSCHREVLGLEPKIQQACLRKAEAEGWSSTDLRIYVRSNWKRGYSIDASE